MITCVQITAAVLAVIFVMVLHELPKAIVYNITSRKKESITCIFHISRYIDPIGMLFCIVVGAGFSKPYRYKIESKRQAFANGLTGLCSLLLVFLIFMIIYSQCYTGLHMREFIEEYDMFLQFSYWFIALVLLNSLGMFFVNLMPIATLDMGLIVASISLPTYIAMIRKDTEMKVVLWIVLVLQAIPIGVIKIVNLL